MRTLLISVFVLMGVLTLAQPPANGREMGYAVSNAADDDFEAAYGYAQAACMRTIHISFRWSAIRPDTLSWGAAAMQLMDISDIYFPLTNTKVEVQLSITNTVTDEMPAELMGLPYDDPLVIAEFLRTLDTVFARMPNVELAALNIGNESDVLWQANTAKYQQFGNFLQAVKPHAQALYQVTQNDTLSVGTTFTWGGLTDATQGPLCQLTNAAADHISATYYGITTGFQVKPPSDVMIDIDALVAGYPGNKPIRFAEIGYPTSATCNSNEQLQSDFISAMFTAWDAHMDRIKYMGYFLTTDWSQSTVDTLGVYYGISDPAFLEFLRTLGLRTHPDAGTNKLAYNSLLCELNVRNFCSTPCTIGIQEPAERPTLSISPNPATGSVSIYGENIGSTDLVEFILLSGQGSHTLRYARVMDVSAFARGAYMVRIGKHAPLLMILD